MLNTFNGGVVTNEFGCLPPVCIRHNEVNRRIDFRNEVRSKLDGNWAWVEQQRGSPGLNKIAGNHPFVAATMDSDFAIGQRFCGESCRIGREHFLAGMHEDRHARLKCYFGNE